MALSLRLGLSLLTKAVSGLLSPGQSALPLEDNSSFILLEDGASALLLE